jgi:hypothetical protein
MKSVLTEEQMEEIEGKSIKAANHKQCNLVRIQACVYKSFAHAEDFRFGYLCLTML